eukprot:Nk52_evm112s226 gene=Nk52_evmTU112s226
MPCWVFILDARYGDTEDVLNALKNGHPVDDQDDNGNTALHMAAANGHYDLVKQLLENGFKGMINKQNEYGNSALHWATVNNHMSVAKLLLENGADIELQNGSGKSPFYEAVLKDSKDMLDMMQEMSVEEGTEEDGGAEEEQENEGEQEESGADKSPMAGK